MCKVGETDVYRGPGRLFAVPLVGVGCALALLVFVISRDAQTWIIGVFAFLFVFNVSLLLRRPYEVTIASDGMLTFRSLVARRAVRVDDVRRIRHRKTQGGDGVLRFSFNRGSATMAGCQRIYALESRLREMNPSIE
jgi:hypothetical protein